MARPQRMDLIKNGLPLGVRPGSAEPGRGCAPDRCGAARCGAARLSGRARGAPSCRIPSGAGRPEMGGGRWRGGSGAGKPDTGGGCGWRCGAPSCRIPSSAGRPDTGGGIHSVQANLRMPGGGGRPDTGRIKQSIPDTHVGVVYRAQLRLELRMRCTFVGLQLAGRTMYANRKRRARRSERRTEETARSSFSAGLSSAYLQ